MRVRFGILVLTLMMALSGCGGDDKNSAGASPAETQADISTPTDPMTEVTVPCAKFSAAAQRINDAQRNLYDKSGAAGSMAKLASELEALKEGAPDNVRTAVDELIAGFRTASALMKKTSASAQAKLTQLIPQLSVAGKTLSDYVVSKCSG